MQDMQKRNMKLLAMPGIGSTMPEARTQVAVTTQAVESVDRLSHQPHSSAAVLSVGGDNDTLESSMTDDNSCQVEVVRPRRQRRHRGADDVFPSHAVHRYQVHASDTPPGLACVITFVTYVVTRHRVVMAMLLFTSMKSLFVAPCGLRSVGRIFVFCRVFSSVNQCEWHCIA